MGDELVRGECETLIYVRERVKETTKLIPDPKVQVQQVQCTALRPQFLK